MPRSDAKFNNRASEDGRNLAILAESLYLANLLLAPGICFAMLFWLWRKHKDSAPLLAVHHLKQTTFVSLYGGLLIVILTSLFLALGGLHWAWTWVVVILYFTCVHSTLVLFGIFGLSKALAGQTWRYPLIGPTVNGKKP